VYRGVLVRRPSLLLYVGLFIAALYISGVLFQKVSPMWLLELNPDRLVSSEVYRFYGHARRYDSVMLSLMYPYSAFAVFSLVANFLYRAKERKHVRDRTLAGQSLVFRSYYNYWLRSMSRYAVERREDYVEELAPFSSVKEAHDSISTQAKVEAKAASAADAVERRRMI
jgi:hypothetical protein